MQYHMAVTIRIADADCHAPFGIFREGYREWNRHRTNTRARHRFHLLSSIANDDRCKYAKFFSHLGNKHAVHYGTLVLPGKKWSLC
jgi:hypothetical protein